MRRTILYSEAKFIITGNTKVLRSKCRGIPLNIVQERLPITGTRIARLTVLHKNPVPFLTPALLKYDSTYEKASDTDGIGHTPINIHLKHTKSLSVEVNSDAEATSLPRLTELAVGEISDGCKIAD